jgi:dTDP-4-dehydrorhamnose 3,5-epimerase
MQVSETSLPGVKILTPKRFGDHRGFFAETYSRRTLAAAGIDTEFVQDNVSVSTAAGTVRGLHFQVPPFAQAKLVYPAQGSIYDVVVDIRRGAPTFGRHVGVTLSATEGNQIYVPEGFAHGLCTLEPGTQVVYKVSAFYAPQHEAGIRWDDPALAIAWPVERDRAVVVDRDARLPLIADLPAHFTCDPTASGAG